VTATRALWTPEVLAEGSLVSLYDPGEERTVAIQLSDLRPAGACPVPTNVTICERVPPGWTVTRASAGGSIGDGSVSWTVDLSGGLPAPLSYDVMTDSGSGLVTFQGTVGETAGARSFAIGGDRSAAGSASVAPISDFGSIQHWLILGPFTREVTAAEPRPDQIVRDYLTDGTVEEETVRPRAGDILLPDYNGLAASTGLAPDAFGRNPGGSRTGSSGATSMTPMTGSTSRACTARDQVVCHAITYLEVEADTVVSLGVSSDDSVQILLDGEQIHINNVARGATGRVYQDTPATHPGLGNIALGAGGHVLLVKVFEGDGEHNFRVGFLDESGLEIPGGPEGVTVTSSRPRLRPSDSGEAMPIASGELDITDGVFTLNFLFSGGPAPPARTRPTRTGAATSTSRTDRRPQLSLPGPGNAGAPGPESCGPDPVEDGLGPCAYESC
jgi:hypothetical protein